ncbi:MAG: YgiT-type zinc finger protein [[Eubacterium] siraeum]
MKVLYYVYASANDKNSFTTHVVNYSNSVVIIKNVPCEECEQCGEIILHR